MHTRIHPKKLLVEGRKDKRVIPFLIEANGIDWKDAAGKPRVYIDEFDGVSNLLQPGVIEAELKASGVKHVGIVVDANDDATSRFNSIRQRCIASFPTFPATLPANGIVETNADGVTLGVWLMPDNQSHGMMESFLLFLAPDRNDAVVKFAEAACATARSLGAPFRPSHDSKAKIHTWLAWQDEPGRQLHEAVRDKVLDASSDHASAFVAWFRTAFAL